MTVSSILPEHDMTKPVGEHRSRLYFDQYRYAIKVNYLGSRFLGFLDPEYVHNQYSSAASLSWNQPTMPLAQVLEVAADLKNLGPGVKLITSWRTMFVYSNDLADHARLCRIQHVTVGSYREALVTLPAGVLLRRNPQFLYRSYFRERRMEGTQSENFLQFVTSRGDYFNLDPTTRMRLALVKHRYPFARHSFIEHNSLMDVTMLEMVLPGAIRQTLPVQAK